MTNPIVREIAEGLKAKSLRLEAEVERLRAENREYEEMVARYRDEHDKLRAQLAKYRAFLLCLRNNWADEEDDGTVNAQLNSIDGLLNNIDAMEGAAPPVVGPNLVVGDDGNVYELNIVGNEKPAAPNASALKPKVPPSECSSDVNQPTAGQDTQQRGDGDGKAADICECGHPLSNHTDDGKGSACCVACSSNNFWHRFKAKGGEQ